MKHYYRFYREGYPSPSLLFEVLLPDVGVKGFYRQTVSFNAFNNRVAGRSIKKTFWFYQTDEYERAERKKVDSEYGFDSEHGLIPIKCDSIWDFYVKIGWDYKKKRFSLKELEIMERNT